MSGAISKSVLPEEGLSLPKTRLEGSRPPPRRPSGPVLEQYAVGLQLFADPVGSGEVARLLGRIAFIDLAVKRLAGNAQLVLSRQDLAVAEARGRQAAL